MNTNLTSTDLKTVAQFVMLGDICMVEPKTFDGENVSNNTPSKAMCELMNLFGLKIENYAFSFHKNVICKNYVEPTHSLASYRTALQLNSKNKANDDKIVTNENNCKLVESMSWDDEAISTDMAGHFNEFTVQPFPSKQLVVNFIDEGDVQRHRPKNVLLEKYSDLECKFCSKTLSEKRLLKKHIAVMHTTNEINPSRFLGPKKRSENKRNNRFTSDGKYKCDCCDKGWNSKIDLKYHTWEEHTPDHLRLSDF